MAKEYKDRSTVYKWVDNKIGYQIGWREATSSGGNRYFWKAIWYIALVGAFFGAYILYPLGTSILFDKAKDFIFTFL
jgi:hypothetical protein